MSRTVGIYIHRHLNSDQRFDIEQLWLDIKSLMASLGVTIATNQVNDILLNEAELTRWHSMFTRLFGVVGLAQHTETSALTVQYDSAYDNKDVQFVSPCDDPSIKVKEYLRIAMYRDKSSLILFEELKEQLRMQGKYEFSFSLDEGNIDPLIVLGDIVIGQSGKGLSVGLNKSLNLDLGIKD